MSIARWEPFSQLRRMREEMDRMFGTLWPTPVTPWMPETVSPPVDVYEKDNNIMVRANLPGLHKEDIEVTATEDSISLGGEFKREEEVKEEGYIRRERQMGRFYRTIPMPAAIKPDDVKASFKDGVLEITAPKSEAARAKEKKVKIET